MFLHAHQPVIVSYHERIMGTVYEERSETGLCLSPDTLWNLLLLLLSHVFDSSTDGVYPVHTLFRVALLLSKTKVKTVLVRDVHALC